jgi:hypothetical protein
MVFPSIEITSVAKFVSGFYNSSKVGNTPKGSQAVYKNNNNTRENPPRIRVQKRFI